MIKLASDNFDKRDRRTLAEWILTNPRLSQGELVKEFEQKFSDYIGCKHCVFVNSGSSANLAMIYALKLSGRLKNNKIVIPAISWATSASPGIQLGFQTIICDVELNNFSVDLDCLSKIFKKYKPAVLLAVNILGFSPQYDEIIHLCKEYDVILLEDNCESIGSQYKLKKLGNFGLMSSHSMYMSHQMSCVEGGAVCTDDKELYNILRMIRNHGWSRDLPSKDQKKLRKKYKVSEFESLYKFYYPGFNIRNTEIGAFLGLRQLDKLDDIVQKRQDNFNLYQEYLNMCSPLRGHKGDTISSFAYPIVHTKRDKIIKALNKNNIENRPLVCGNMGNQPFIKKANCIVYDNMAQHIDNCGFYVPNHPNLTKDDIQFVCDVIRRVI